MRGVGQRPSTFGSAHCNRNSKHIFQYEEALLLNFIILLFGMVVGVQKPSICDISSFKKLILGSCRK